jgi:mediator of RNA polymerase II transcription subunit 5
MAPEDQTAFNTWFHALFDKNSEGIEDTFFRFERNSFPLLEFIQWIHRSTRPTSLLRICSALFLQAITLVVEKRIDKDTLNNGLNYFHTPLLSWTLVGPMKALIAEVIRKG